MAIRIAVIYLVVPFYFLFWINDWLLFPEQKWTLLFVRCWIVPLALSLYLASKKFRTWKKIQRAVLVFMLLTGVHTSVMMYVGGAFSYTYVTGLVLMQVATVAFVPFDRKYFIWAPTALLLPPFVTATLFFIESSDQIAINLLYVAAGLSISVFMRQFMERFRINELKVRMDLKGEVNNRQKVIENKTEENVQLTNLSRQFSPQVVEALQSSKLGYDSKVHNTEICALFVDIVGSTTMVESQSGDDIDQLITKFMEISSNVLLRFDITIDKFLGDGVLAFSNVPFEYEDFIERAIKASLDLQRAFAAEQEDLDHLAGRPFQIRIGIAVGHASVGFYGSNSTYHSYTAIGSVINLAHRLCDAAEPGQITTHQELVDRVVSSDTQKTFDVQAIGERDLKGFGSKNILTIEAAQSYCSSQAESNCELCGGMLRLDLSAPGANIFKCRSCGHTVIEKVDKAG